MIWVPCPSGSIWSLRTASTPFIMGIEVVGVIGTDLDDLLITDRHRVEVPGAVLPVVNTVVVVIDIGVNTWRLPHVDG